MGALRSGLRPVLVYPKPLSGFLLYIGPAEEGGYVMEQWTYEGERLERAKIPAKVYDMLATSGDYKRAEDASSIPYL